MAEPDPSEARAQAQEILAGDRYQARDVPRPLEGVLRWIGERLQDLGDPVARLLSTPAGVAVTVTIVAVVAAALIGTAVARRSRLAVEAEARQVRRRSVDPKALEREADAAERAGDLATAVRLRFRAGVARLATAGVREARPGATTGRLVAVVSSPRFAELASAFDAIAYGGRSATAEDVEASRRGWPEVLAEIETRQGGHAPDAAGATATGAAR